VRRHAIGIIAVVLLVSAAALWIWPLEVSWHEPLKAACSRLGPFMAVLWLAYNEVKRMPPWLLATIPALVLVLAVRPKWFLIALPIVIALAILRPRSPSRR
jgi:hypothetical protein